MVSGSNLKLSTRWMFVCTLLLSLAGCGGGGGSGSGGGSTSGSLRDQQVTGYEQTASGPMIDVRNLVVGQVVQLEITARNSADALVVASASGWTTTAPSSVATISSSGVLTAVGSSAGTAYTVSVRSGGVTYSAPLIVTPLKDIVTGYVQNVDDAVEGAIIDFYDASGNQVGTAYSARNGAFQASLPSTATQFTIDLSGVDPTGIYYYTEYAYNTNEYLEGTSCLASLPALTSTGITALPTPIVPSLKSGGPPPPPTGCVGG